MILLKTSLVTALDCQGHPKTKEGGLKQFLLCDYERLLPPVTDHTTTLLIKKFTIDVRSFEFHENSGILDLYSWLTMSWKDEHLLWDPQNFNGIDRIIVNFGEIWIPDIYLDQSKTGNLVTKASKIDCWVWRNGTVSCTIPILLEVLCIANYTNWPHDSQKCSLNFLTWSYLAEQVDFDNDTLRFDVSEAHESMVWRVVRTEVIGRWTKYWDEDQTNVGIEFDIYIERSAEEPKVVYLIPTILLSTLNVVTMVIRMESRTRLVLASINITLQFLWNTQHTWYASYHTDSMPILFVYFQHSYLITMLVIVETVVLSTMKNFKVTLPQWASFRLEQLAMQRIVQILLVDVDGTFFIIRDGEKIDRADDSWTTLLKIVDRLLMLIMIVTYCAMFKLLLPTMEN